MSWLLELLLDAIGEMFSQFIIDMMELVTNMFTELLSCDLTLFEELFSVVGSLYSNVIVPMGIAILLLILVWQLFKSMFSKVGINGEEPVELVIRSAIALFFVVAAKPLINYILNIAGTPYQWVAGTQIEVQSFSGYVTALGNVTDVLGIGSLSISILKLILQFVVAWNYFKMLFVIAERYVLLGIFAYTAPLAFSTGGSKATNNILASWSKMFGGQVVLVILNAWCMKMYLSGYGNMLASSYGFTKFFAATLCLIGFCKITFKLDSYMASLGVNLGRPSPGPGAMGLLMAAGRILSQAGRAASGAFGREDRSGGGGTDMGSADGMSGGFGGPIPMGPSGGGGMDMSPIPSDGDFDSAGEKTADFGTDGEAAAEPPGMHESKSVLEEIGGFSSVEGGGSRISYETGSGAGNVERMPGETSAEAEKTEGYGAENNSRYPEEEKPMDMFAEGIPSYAAEGGMETSVSGDILMGADGGDASAKVTGGAVEENADFAHGDSLSGDFGDYPVEEEMGDFDTDLAMELENAGIESMDAGGKESAAGQTAGDVYGNGIPGSYAGSGGVPGNRKAPGGKDGMFSADSVNPTIGSQGILDEISGQAIEGYGGNPDAPDSAFSDGDGLEAENSAGTSDMALTGGIPADIPEQNLTGGIPADIPEQDMTDGILKDIPGQDMTGGIFKNIPGQDMTGGISEDIPNQNPGGGIQEGAEADGEISGLQRQQEQDENSEVSDHGVPESMNFPGTTIPSGTSPSGRRTNARRNWEVPRSRAELHRQNNSNGAHTHGSRHPGEGV